MGRLSNEPIINHFSHPHPLHLSSPNHPHNNPLLPSPLCANCTLPATSGWVYTCTPCNFILHATPCSQMPPLINHPSHMAHPLTLLPVPAYSEGSFDCDACSARGTGFSYRCGTCDLDLHTVCASRPMSVATAAHAHVLALTFAPPYESKGFSCDVCGNMGTSQWMYRCVPCEFDAHLECGELQVHRSGSLPVQGTPRAAAVGYAVPMNRSGSGGMQGLVRNGSGSGRGTGAGSMVRHMVQGLVNTATQSIGNKLVPGYVGGDVNGGGRGGPGAWNGPGQGGRGRGGYNGWNGNGGGRGSGGDSYGKDLIFPTKLKKYIYGLVPTTIITYHVT